MSILKSDTTVIITTYNDSYIVNVIESLDIDYYYPHPKEKKSP